MWVSEGGKNVKWPSVNEPRCIRTETSHCSIRLYVQYRAIQESGVSPKHRRPSQYMSSSVECFAISCGAEKDSPWSEEIDNQLPSASHDSPCPSKDLWVSVSRIIEPSVKRKSGPELWWLRSGGCSGISRQAVHELPLSLEKHLKTLACKIPSVTGSKNVRCGSLRLIQVDTNIKRPKSSSIISQFEREPGTPCMRVSKHQSIFLHDIPPSSERESWIVESTAFFCEAVWYPQIIGPRVVTQRLGKQAIFSSRPVREDSRTKPWHSITKGLCFIVKAVFKWVKLGGTDAAVEFKLTGQLESCCDLRIPSMIRKVFRASPAGDTNSPLFSNTWMSSLTAPNSHCATYCGTSA